MLSRTTRKFYLSPFQFISVSFLSAISAGTLLLMLPFSSRTGTVTPFLDALFTATSVVCVTGLAVVDTATHWSPFGQFVLLLLMELGGLGVITFAASAALVSGQKLGLLRLQTLQEAMASRDMDGILSLMAFVLKLTATVELTGAALMAPVFIRDFGTTRGLWLSLFHAASAYCNAGFDLMGIREPFSSMTSYVQNPLINIVIVLLILTGGLGFMTWNDFRVHKFRFKRYSLQSKLILAGSAILIISPTLFFYIHEFSGPGRFWASLFQAVTPRTAGFNTVDIASMSSLGQAVIILLMLVGGAPGSTAGGMKVTTFYVLGASARAVFLRKRYVQCFGRRLPEDTVNYATAILLMYLTLFFTTAFAICWIDGLPLGECLFETASALCTVGLSVGVTAQAGATSRLILTLLMFMGRVGGLTVVFAAISQPTAGNSPLFPEEKVTVG